MAISLAERILRLTKDYVAVRSDTCSKNELDVNTFFQSWFETVPYLVKNPHLCGHFAIPGDPLSRAVSWCLRLGPGSDTVGLLHLRASV